jgi:hypothetical protein
MHDLNLQTPCFRRPYGFWLAGLSALLLATAAPAQTSRQAEDGDAPVAATAQLTLDDLRTFTDGTTWRASTTRPCWNRPSAAC